MTESLINRTPIKAFEPAVVVGPAAIRPEIVSALHDEGLEVSVVDGVEALTEMSHDRAPSLIVLVGDLSGRALSSTLESLGEHSPDAHIVLVCTSIQGWEVRAALAAGADGIVLVAEASTALGPCLLAVQAGQTCVPHRHGRQIERPVLSLREKQILGLVVKGYTNSQIGDSLFLAESTVKSHLSSVYCKLEVRSRAEAAELILNPDRGMAMGILTLGSEPAAQSSTTTQ
jgi:DNA-binding NarL/FixJ family response regulator